MKYYNDQNTDGYTPEQLNKMNQEIETLIETNGWDMIDNDTQVKNAAEKILAEMDREQELYSGNQEKIFAVRGCAADFGIQGRGATCSCIVFGVNEGIPVDAGLFFNEKGMQKLRKGKKLFLFDFDQGYRTALEKYPELY